MTTPNEAVEEESVEANELSELPESLTTQGLRDRIAEKLGRVAVPEPAVEAAPEEPEEPAEPTTPEEEPEETEEPVESEEPEESEAEETPEEAEARREQEFEDNEDFFLARYRTKEAALEGMAEKDRMIDTLFRENHQLRDQREAEPQDRQLDVPAWKAWAEDQVEQGAGIAGAMQALERGGEDGYDIYFAEWAKDEDQRAEALAFNNKVQRNIAKLEAQQAVEPALQRDRQDTAAADAVAAQQRVAAQHPDFAEYREEMDRIMVDDSVISPATKQFLAELAEQGPDGKERAWEFVYMAAKATKAPTRRAAQAEAKKQRRASADADKVAATVSSAEGTAVSTPLSAEEREINRRKNVMRARNGMELLPEE